MLFRNIPSIPRDTLIEMTKKTTKKHIIMQQSTSKNNLLLGLMPIDGLKICLMHCILWVRLQSGRYGLTPE